MKRLLPIILLILVACQPELTGEVIQELPVEQVVLRTPQQYGVNINGSSLDPPSITIAEGDRIVFTNVNSREYKIQEESYRMFESPYLPQGSSYTHTFNKPGKFTVEILDQDQEQDTSRRERWSRYVAKATIEVMDYE